jgi:hypothetical protein
VRMIRGLFVAIMLAAVTMTPCALPEVDHENITRQGIKNTTNKPCILR